MNAVCSCDDDALVDHHFSDCPISTETDGWKYINRDDLKKLLGSVPDMYSIKYKTALYDATNDVFYTVWGHSHLSCLAVHRLTIDNMLDLETGWAIREPPIEELYHE